MTALGRDKIDAIHFLVESRALKFGDFTLKSGRQAPYFINTGCFDSGALISRLGDLYAEKFLALDLSNITAVFGPAYKGVPLCVATSISLNSKYNTNVGFTFNRKEAKSRGEGGELVGKSLSPGDRVVVVEDVVTAGTTLQEVVPMLRGKYQVEVAAVIILVDRCEKGAGSLSAVQEAEESLGIKVHPIVTITDIITYLEQPNESGLRIEGDLRSRIAEYRARFGVAA